MAYDFDGTNDNLTINGGIVGIDIDVFTICATFEMDEATPGTEYCILNTTAAVPGSASDSGCVIVMDNVSQLFEFQYIRDAVAGRWSLATPTPATGTIYRFVATYDRSSVGSNPIVHFNGVKKTVGSGLTEEQTPTGNANSGLDSIILGENLFNQSDFNGRIAEVAMWSGALDDGLANALSIGFSPKYFPVNRLWYAPLIRELSDINQGTLFVATGATVADHFPVFYPSFPIALSQSTPQSQTGPLDSANQIAQMTQEIVTY